MNKTKTILIFLIAMAVASFVIVTHVTIGDQGNPGIVIIGQEYNNNGGIINYTFTVRAAGPLKGDEFLRKNTKFSDVSVLFVNANGELIRRVDIGDLHPGRQQYHGSVNFSEQPVAGILAPKRVESPDYKWVLGAVLHGQDCQLSHDIIQYIGSHNEELDSWSGNETVYDYLNNNTVDGYLEQAYEYKSGANEACNNSSKGPRE
jgi:hypothetical protein